MRLATAPGAYSPVTSDFDQLRLRILKQKKMAVRSGWAQNIAFTSTEGRFQQHTGIGNLDGPPANAYYPKTGIADNLSKPNARGGAFGAKEKVDSAVVIVFFFMFVMFVSYDTLVYIIMAYF